MSEFRIILASGSPYRASILKSLGMTFDRVAADIDETPIENEEPRKLAQRLGLEKARKVADSINMKDPWLVIGSDQVCHHLGTVYGKPGNREKAVRQLAAFSGNKVIFSSSLAIICSDGRKISLVEDYECQFRELDLSEIERYVDLDQPFDCAGAIRIEKAAALLMSDTCGRDINTLLGLPVMALRESLAILGCNIFDFN